MDALGFIASGISVKEIAKALEKVGRLILEWRGKNMVTYDTQNRACFIFSCTTTTFESATPRDHSINWGRKDKVQQGCNALARNLAG